MLYPLARSRAGARPSSGCRAPAGVILWWPARVWMWAAYCLALGCIAGLLAPAAAAALLGAADLALLEAGYPAHLPVPDIPHSVWAVTLPLLVFAQAVERKSRVWLAGGLLFGHCRPGRVLDLHLADAPFTRPPGAGGGLRHNRRMVMDMLEVIATLARTQPDAGLVFRIRTTASIGRHLARMGFTASKAPPLPPQWYWRLQIRAKRLCWRLRGRILPIDPGSAANLRLVWRAPAGVIRPPRLPSTVPDGAFAVPSEERLK